MKKKALNFLGRLQVYIRLDLAIPVVLVVYLLVRWLGR